MLPLHHMGRVLGMLLPMVLLALVASDACALDPPAPTPTAEELAAMQVAMAADATAAVPESPAVVDSALMPQISLIFDGAAAWFSDRDNLQQGGHDPMRTGFNLQQLELHMESNVDPYLHFAANIVWGPDGVELEEGFASTTSLPGNLQIKAGKFLNPFGRLNPTHPHAWHFVDAPFALTRMLGPDGSRGLGAEFAWLAPLPWFLEVRVAVSHPDPDTGRSFVGSVAKPVHTFGDMVWTGNVRQFFALHDDWSLYWGLSTQQGTGPAAATDKTQIYASDLYLRWRPVENADRSALSLQVEGLLRRRDWIGRQMDDWAGYAQVVGEINPRWEVGGRAELGSGVTDDPLDPAWTGKRQRCSLQATYYPSHFARLRLQSSIDVPSWRPEPIYACMLALETVIGAHGAHSY